MKRKLKLNLELPVNKCACKKEEASADSHEKKQSLRSTLVNYGIFFHADAHTDTALSASDR